MLGHGFQRAACARSKSDYTPQLESRAPQFGLRELLRKRSPGMRKLYELYPQRISRNADMEALYQGH